MWRSFVYVSPSTLRIFILAYIEHCVAKFTSFLHSCDVAKIDMKRSHFRNQGMWATGTYTLIPEITGFNSNLISTEKSLDQHQIRTERKLL